MIAIALLLRIVLVPKLQVAGSVPEAMWSAMAAEIWLAPLFSWRLVQPVGAL